jgi:phosphoglycerate dehydrogenase-like enzyme
VDTDALRDALRDGRIAGAGLDVFEPEPLLPDDELLTLDNVVLSPHSLCWTEDFTRDVAASAISSILAVAAGERPANVLNPEVFDTEAFAAKQAQASVPRPSTDPFTFHTLQEHP